MKKLFHTAASIERMLADFEFEYGLSSEEFYERHATEDVPEIPGFHRHVWASMYRDALRLRGSSGDFAARAERSLSLV